MATKKIVDMHLKRALKEVGEITPWYDEEVQEWVFAHPLYPVEYGGKSSKEVIKNYPKYLREFIAHRLDGRLEHKVEKKTKGRGGKRPGAGRPKGTKRVPPTQIMRLDARIAEWIKKHENEVYHLISGKMKVVQAKRARR